MKRGPATQTVVLTCWTLGDGLQPPDALEAASEQGSLSYPGAAQKPQRAAKRSTRRPGADGPDKRGRHSHPGSRGLNGDVDDVGSPTRWCCSTTDSASPASTELF